MQPYSIIHAPVYAGKRPNGTVGLFKLIEKLPWDALLVYESSTLWEPQTRKSAKQLH